MNRRYNCNHQIPIICLLRNQPQAIAVINGSEKCPDIHGLVRFYQTCDGVVVYAEINGLPKEQSTCNYMILGFHIHNGTSCTGDAHDPFSDAMAHYNPDNCNHPYHAGDLPPLFASNGKALLIFQTNRFRVDEIIGKTMIIHDSPDDFKTQPSGDSGNKIACGVICRVAR